MTIQFNTDRNIHGNEKLSAHFSEQIVAALGRFGERITRVDVHVTDATGHKDGPRHKRCVMEARIKGRGPFAVTHMDYTLEQAIQGALHKFSLAMETIHSQMIKHRL
jgi:hypothetical protein